jgi:hypothetical protein
MERFWGVVQLLIGLPSLVFSAVCFGEFAWLLIDGDGGAFVLAGALFWAMGILASGYLSFYGGRKLMRGC